MFGNAHIFFIDPRNSTTLKAMFTGCEEMAVKLGIPEPYYFESAMINDKLEISMGVDFELQFEDKMAAFIFTLNKGRVVHSESALISSSFPVHHIPFIMEARCQVCNDKNYRTVVAFASQNEIKNISSSVQFECYCTVHAAEKCKLSLNEFDARISGIRFMTGMVATFLRYVDNGRTHAFKYITNKDICLKKMIIQHLRGYNSVNTYHLFNDIDIPNIHEVESKEADSILRYLHANIESWKDNEYLKFYYYAYKNHPYICDWNVTFFRSMIPILHNQYELDILRREADYLGIVGDTFNDRVVVRKQSLVKGKTEVIMTSLSFKAAYISRSPNSFFPRSAYYDIDAKIVGHRIHNGVKYTIIEPIGQPTRIYDVYDT